MNRKGQAGHIISTVAVMFIIFFIMAVFLLISYSVGAIRTKLGYSNGLESSVRVESLPVSYITKETGEETSVLDILRKWKIGIYSRDDVIRIFREHLDEAPEEAELCLGLSYGSSEGDLWSNSPPFTYVLLAKQLDGKIVEHNILSELVAPGSPLIKKFKLVDSETYYANYFYGECEMKQGGRS